MPSELLLTFAQWRSHALDCGAGLQWSSCWELALRIGRPGRFA
jgi:hypothetical protein